MKPLKVVIATLAILAASVLEIHAQGISASTGTVGGSNGGSGYLSSPFAYRTGIDGWSSGGYLPPSPFAKGNKFGLTLRDPETCPWPYPWPYPQPYPRPYPVIGVDPIFGPIPICPGDGGHRVVHPPSNPGTAGPHSPDPTRVYGGDFILKFPQENPLTGEDPITTISPELLSWVRTADVDVYWGNLFKKRSVTNGSWKLTVSNEAPNPKPSPSPNPSDPPCGIDPNAPHDGGHGQATGCDGGKG